MTKEELNEFIENYTESPNIASPKTLAFYVNREEYKYFMNLIQKMIDKKKNESN